MADDMDSRLDVAIQPLFAIEADLRKSGHFVEGDAVLSDRLWGAIETLQGIVRDLAARNS